MKTGRQNLVSRALHGAESVVIFAPRAVPAPEHPIRPRSLPT